MIPDELTPETRDSSAFTASEESSSPTDMDEIWRATQEELRFQLARPGYDTWLANASLLEAADGKFKIGVPTRFARDWVTERYLQVITETLSGIVGKECQIEIAIDPRVNPGTANGAETAAKPGFATATPASQTDAATTPLPPSLTASPGSWPDQNTSASGTSRFDSRLNPSFTFSSFVVGNSSRFAHAACNAVAEAPGKAYNPLFLYGGVGLGKTHLMHAIGQAVAEKGGGKPVIAYVTSEKFVNEMVDSIGQNKMHDFRMRYRSVDVLLIDDIQFLAGKDRTQEEFFHTFNALHQVQKQIVVSSDRPPKDIPTLEDRLRSRFEGGLMADIQPPDFETRLAIINNKLGLHASLVPDEVCTFIAHKIQKNIRELEGALIRVLAHASIDGRTVDIATAAEILKDIIPGDTAKQLSATDIQSAVCEYYGITPDEIKGKRRDKRIVFPRQVAMYLMREDTPSSLPAIGAAFGGRDHTTVLHSCEKIADLVKEDERLQSDLRNLRELLAHD